MLFLSSPTLLRVHVQHLASSHPLTHYLDSILPELGCAVWQVLASVIAMLPPCEAVHLERVSRCAALCPFIRIMQEPGCSHKRLYEPLLMACITPQ